MTTDRIAALEAALEWIDKHDDAGDALYRAPRPFAAKARAALAASRAAATEPPGDLIRRQNVLEICESHGASGEAIGDEVAALPTVQPQPVAVQQAAQVPEIAAMIEAANNLNEFLRGEKVFERSGYGPKLRQALRAIKGGEA